SPADGRQRVLAGSKASTGHVVLVPVHVSSTSHTRTAARQTVPAWPAGCWHVSLVPSHSSRLHGLPSSAQAVPAGSLESAGQLALFPGQKSARSHSPTDARQSVVEGRKASFGHVELLPVHVSAASQMPAVARHVVPAFPGACWHVSLVPLQRSVVQTL